MEMVSYTDSSTGTIFHRFKLQAQLEGAPTPTQDFQLADQEWSELLKHENRVAWIRLLNNIVRRVSVRAYYHVRNHLIGGYGITVANSEEAEWAGQWNAQPSRNIKELLFARLRSEETNAGPNLLPGGDRSLLITPPCGHHSMLRKISLVALTADACQTFCCPVCGARVLQPADESELCLRNVCLRAQAFVDNYSGWTELDDDITEERQNLDLPALAVMCALSGALASQKLPSLISPPEMSFIGLQETKLVFAEIEETFGEGEWTVTGTPKGLFDGLIGLARIAIAELVDSPALSEETLPPGWSQNIRLWLTRAVRLVFDRGCTINDPQHAGLHLHDGELHCGVLDADE